MTANGINFESVKSAGSISTLTFGVDISVEPCTSGNPMVSRVVSSACPWRPFGRMRWRLRKTNATAVPFSLH